MGVNLGKMKNGEEKSEEKIILVVVWLRREKREDYNRTEPELRARGGGSTVGCMQ